MQAAYRVIGTMSGTSLDGLDLALCTFTYNEDKWLYTIERAKTYPHSNEWKHKLATAETMSGLDLTNLHNEFGIYTGKLINDFLKDEKQSIDFIASHGHTIFHQPHIGLTLQIGNGAHIAATTGINTICDFRSLDVALGGQGAPLVPIGDKLLFYDYDYCLNLGGFANISFDRDGVRMAYDICPVNIVVNHLVKERSLSYDPEGSIGSTGALNDSLLTSLNSLPFYQNKGPKSLGKEWVLENILPLIDKYPIQLEDKLRTFYEHIAIQLTNAFSSGKNKKVLITGGGAYNTFLMGLMKGKTEAAIDIPNPDIIEFKEALIFAFLGVLRYRNEINCLKSVTGASRDNSGGIIYMV